MDASPVPMQVYRGPLADLRLWFEADSHETTEVYGETNQWGGLWNATGAEAFAANAAKMYTGEPEWQEWQQVGFSLADLLYSHARLQVVKVSRSCVFNVVVVCYPMWDTLQIGGY